VKVIFLKKVICSDINQLVGLPIPGSLSEEVNERLAGGGVTSSRSTQGLTQGRVDDVNAALKTKIFFFFKYHVRAKPD
jgi:hypothetical protein